MPALPPKPSRRKGVTPISNLHREDVWQRTLDIMGLEPLTAPRKSTTTAPMPSSSPSSPPSSTTAPSQKISILDLPQETQRQISKHASITDLVALSLVSKHFRDIAAERLYRSFHIIFPDEDHPSHDLQIDDLASGLDTFVTSDYNYSQYLKEIVLETLSGGEKGERTYRHYLYDASCGKFMNTLLLLTLRNAFALETFRWDIRVELSRDVFKALHNIKSLQHLRLRMQAGSSIYRAPPAIPPSTILTSNGSELTIAPQHNLNPPSIFGPPPPAFPTALPPLPPISSPTSISSKASTKFRRKNSLSLLPVIKTNPATLSGFKNLKTLAMLDMDTLEYISELKTCITNCASTLSSLELSFSEYLASRTRKPPPEMPSDDETDQEDEFGQLLPAGAPPLPSSSPVDVNAPSKAFKAQEEKKAQEGTLARILDTESMEVKTPPVSTPKLAPELEMKSAMKYDEDPDKMFAKNLSQVAAKLMKAVKPGGDLLTDGKEALELITKAANIYLEKIEPGSVSKTGERSASSSTAKATPASSSVGVEDAIPAAEEGPSLFDVPERPKKKSSAESGVSNPEDIDIEEPEANDLSMDFDSGGDPAEQSSEAIIPEATTAIAAPEQGESSKGETQGGTALSQAQKDILAKLSKLSSDPSTDIESINHLRNNSDATQEWALLDDYATHILPMIDRGSPEYPEWKRQFDRYLEKLNAGETIPQAEKASLIEAQDLCIDVSKGRKGLGRTLSEKMARVDAARDEIQQIQESEMADYIRKTRGLRLENLSIYLIPARASTLSKAFDLTVLKSVTLLSVGPQATFWNLISKEDKASPLPLRKIHTDNVTPTFLACATQLSTLTELYLLERSQKARAESTAAKSTVTMEQIRKAILKKHAGSLKILMIRNDAGNEWDINVKSTLLLCRRAKQLEELAVSFGIKTMHALLQNMPGLTSLRALHTIQFRTEDTCLWVMREFRKFTLDNVSHNPSMQLQWLALDNSVEALVRRTKSLQSKSKKVDKKGKGKATDKPPAYQPISQVMKDLISEPSNGAFGSSWTAVENTTSPVNGSANGSGSHDWQDTTEDEDEFPRGKAGLKIDSIEGIQFQDVAGVKIFEKNILGGRL